MAVHSSFFMQSLYRCIYIFPTYTMYGEAILVLPVPVPVLRRLGKPHQDTAM